MQHSLIKYNIILYKYYNVIVIYADTGVGDFASIFAFLPKLSPYMAVMPVDNFLSAGKK